MTSHYKADIAMLRLLAIIVVVAFHAYGMCYAEAHLPQPLPKVYEETYEWFNQFIPINVAIPLFVFVSGYLFAIRLQKRKYQSLWHVAKDKFLRLGVPYYFFLPIMMATYSGFKLEPYYTGDIGIFGFCLCYGGSLLSPIYYILSFWGGESGWL